MAVMIGLFGTLAEVLDYFDDKFVLLGSLLGGAIDLVVRDDRPSGDDATGFGPPIEASGDDARILVLVTATALGLVGLGAVFVARQSPGLASLLLIAAGTVGLLVSWFAGVNLALVLLSVLLLLAGLGSAAATIPRRMARTEGA